jgi:hemerythrin-like domain-containing protein
VTLHSTQSGDSRREERRLEKRWHGMQNRRKGKGSHLAAHTGLMPSCEFDDPIGMLKNVHRQIKRALHVLWVIADRAAGRELTSEEMAAVRSAMDCVRVDGTRHTADEEESLFPRLRAETISGDSEELNVLEDNRRVANRLHAIVESLYSAWMSGGTLRSESQLRLQSCTEKLKHLSEQHIQIEERIVFPRAQQVLDRQTTAAIGQEFRARRS